MYYAFTKNNNCFIIKAFDITGIARIVTITIEEGNYTSAELISEIQDQLNNDLKSLWHIYYYISEFN